jgi:hypothetical protein
VITLQTEVPAGNVLIDWALAESKGLAARGWISADLHTKITSHLALNMADDDALLRAIWGARGGFAGHFFTPTTKWHLGACSPDSIGSIGLCRHFQGNHHRTADGKVVHYLTIAELAEDDPGFQLESKFDPTLLFGRPILIGNSAAGPWCLLEGTHRLVDAYRRHAQPTRDVAPLPIIIGINNSASARSWWTQARAS